MLNFNKNIDFLDFLHRIEQIISKVVLIIALLQFARNKSQKFKNGIIHTDLDGFERVLTR
jgi:hypothetical protein